MPLTKSLKSGFAAVLSALALCACADQRPIGVGEIVLVGDSTMSAYGRERYPRLGWGMVLPCGVQPGVTVTNLAASGRSTKSFIDEGRWQAALAALDPGDFLLIQFGHNDQKSEDVKRFTEPAGAFSDNLRAMIDGARAQRATPILVTPVARRKFSQGIPQDTHGAYAQAVRQVAKERRVFFVDLSADVLALIEREGEAGSKALYLHLRPQDSVAAYPDGVADDTHFSEAGARAIARLAVQRLAQDRSPLARLVRPGSASLSPGFIVGGPACTREGP